MTMVFEYSNHYINDPRDLNGFVRFLVDRKPRYVDSQEIRQLEDDCIEAIRILTFNSEFNPPGTFGVLKEAFVMFEEAFGVFGEHRRIKLTSAEIFFRMYPFDQEFGTELSVVRWMGICFIEVLTEIFSGDKICANSIRHTLDKGFLTLFNALRIEYIREVTFVVYQKDQGRDLDPSDETIYTELYSILEGSRNSSENQTHSDSTPDRVRQKKNNVLELGQADVKLFLKALDERKLTEFLRNGILFTHDGPTLKAALIADTQRGLVEEYQEERDSYFSLKTLYQNQIHSHLRRKADEATRRALEMFEHIKADGDAAKGKIARWRQWLSWIYVLVIVLLTILSWIWNWKGADSVWERAFSGIEFATFGLVGVFGLVKLAGEDQNNIRNTFLGWVRLRTEEDVSRYCATQNLSLALALHEKSAQWANGAYTCFALARTHGDISILSGLDMASARTAGIFPISKSVAVDLRTGTLRDIKKGDDPEGNVFRLGGPISPGSPIDATGPSSEGMIFKGPPFSGL